jgi:hypothetical protein
MSPFGIVKFIGAWGCIIGSVICLILIKDIALANTLAVLAIAFGVAPTGA